MSLERAAELARRDLDRLLADPETRARIGDDRWGHVQRRIDEIMATDDRFGPRAALRYLIGCLRAPSKIGWEPPSDGEQTVLGHPAPPVRDEFMPPRSLP